MEAVVRCLPFGIVSTDDTWFAQQRVCSMETLYKWTHGASSDIKLKGVMSQWEGKMLCHN